MFSNNSIENFLSNYNDDVYSNTQKLRAIILKNLPDIIEQLGIPAKMIAYCYGNKYAEMICTIVASKKGLKLGFYKGVELPDPHNILDGTGKISRYVEIKSEEQIKSAVIKQF